MSDIGHYDYHPAYRYQPLFIEDDWKWGRDRNQNPSTEVEGGRTVPWFGATELPYDDRGNTPPGVLYEFMTDDVFGLGMADAELYQPGWEATQAAFADAEFLVSLDQLSLMDFKQFAAQLSEYGNLWLRRRGAQFELGYWKQALTTTEIAALPVIGSDDLAEEPNIEAANYDDCVTEVNVTFQDREAYFHDDVAVFRNPGLKRQLGEARRVDLDRRWITDGAIANSYAAQYGISYGRPRIPSDSIVIKVERIETIEDDGNGPIVGRLFKLDIASISEEIVFRCIECEYPADSEGVCRLKVENERSIWPALFIQPPPGKIGDFIVDVPAVVNYQLVELPSGLTTSTALQIAILAQRPAPSVIGFHTWTSPDDVTYTEANPPCTFAAFAKMHGASGTTTSFTVEFFGVDLPQQFAQYGDNEVLIFIGGEILSFSVWSALGAGLYTIGAIRARYGTTNVSHADATPCFFIRRDHLIPLANSRFIVGGTVYFKLQTYDTKQDFDLADFTPFTYLFGGGAVAAPGTPSLTTSFLATTNGVVNSMITATWTYSGDQNLVSFNASIKKASDSNWITRNVGPAASAIWNFLEPGQSYNVRVQAVNTHGAVSAWSTIATITSASSPILALPTFINDYTAGALGNVSYDELFALSVRVQATTGHKIRFSLNSPVTSTSPFWPALTGGGDGLGTNMVGFIQSDGTGSDQVIGGGPPSGPYKHTTVWFVAEVNPTNPTLIGPQLAITTTYVPVDMSAWPQVPAPFPYVDAGDNSGVTRGQNGYKVRADCVDTAATIYHSTTGLTGSWSVYTAGTQVTLNAGINHYWQAKRYITPSWEQYRDSPIREFSNTTSSVPNSGGGGGGGAGTRLEP